MLHRKQTAETILERTTPRCPHCNGSMIEATVQLGQLTMCWPLPDVEAVRPDGYADFSMPELEGAPIAACPACERLSLFSVRDPDSHYGRFILTPIRTDADRRLLGEEVKARR